MILSRYLIGWKEELRGLYAESEATWLFDRTLQDFLGLNRLWFLSHQQENLSESQLHCFNEVLSALKAGKPYQYISGHAFFFDLKLFVGPEVLIPRPETEELVEWIRKEYAAQSPLSLLDVCTGSGCIALALKSFFPASVVEALDVSEAALFLAEKNARALQLEVSFFKNDILKEALPVDRKYDLIVSNPPYVPLSDLSAMSPTVLDYEPHLALFVADEDPLLFYKRILNLAEKHLHGHGAVFFELHDRTGHDLMQWVEGKGIFNAFLSHDLSGKQRMMKLVFK